MIEKKESIDLKRNLVLTITGGVYLGPCLHIWYSKLLPQIVNRVVGQSTSKFVPAFTGMLFDQLLFAPIFLSGFFVFLGFMNDPSAKGIQKGA